MAESNAWFKGLRESSKSETRKSRGSSQAGDDQLTPRAVQETSRRTSMPNKPATNASISPLSAVTLKPPLPSFSKPNITPRTSSVYIKSSSVDGSLSVEEGSVEESVGSEINLEEAFSFNGAEGESVQVMVRVRPCNQQEIEAAAVSGDSLNNCLRIPESGSTIIAAAPGREPKRFTYDRVLPESSTQEDVFEAAGVPMVDNVLAGYNSSMFCYGQTGSGKTYTMMGELSMLPGGLDERGLAPRMIEHLFSKIAEAEDSCGRSGRETLRYSCRASVLEIYNECITDLLNPSSTNLQIREDPQKGIYVDRLGEKEVLNVSDVMKMMAKGHSNRHVGETNMNARSSRSHCVFTFVVERTSKNRGASEGGSSGVTGVVSSRLNLVDLAGSERVKGGALGGSQAQGEHFKEACHINQSLTTLGRVIMELVESQRFPGGQARHIPYRDSRLTFLLQDSLGGNAKSLIIANVSSSSLCAAETSSTLQFVSRAKCIKNKASINLLYRGDVALLQKEIIRLNTELDALRRGPGSHNEALTAALTENKEFRAHMEKMERRLEEDELRIGGLAAENARLKRDKLKIECRLEEVTEGREKDSETWKLEAEAALAQVKRYEAQIIKLEGEVEEALSRARVAEGERDQHSMDVAAQIRSLNDRLAEEVALAAAMKEAMSSEAVKMAEDAVAKERVRGDAILSSFKSEVEEQLMEMEGLRSEEVSALEDELARLRGAHAQEKACLMHDKVEMEGAMRSEVEALRLKVEQAERQRIDLVFESEESIKALRSEVKGAHDLRQQEVADLQDKIQKLEAAAAAAAEASVARARAEDLKEGSAREREERLKQQLMEAEEAAGTAQAKVHSLSSQLSEAKAELGEKERAIQCLAQERLSHRNTCNKQAKAFSEIMRLIEWATTPPGSSSGSPEPEEPSSSKGVSSSSGAKKLRESLVGLVQQTTPPSAELPSGTSREGVFSKSRLSLLARGDGDLTGEEDDVVASPMVKNRRDQ